MSKHKLLRTTIVIFLSLIFLFLIAYATSPTSASPVAQDKGPQGNAPESPPTVTIQNEYIQAMTSAGGRFIVGTTGGDPNTPNDDNKRLLFGYPTNVGSSFSTLRVVNGSTTSDYRLGNTDWSNPGIPPVTPPTTDGNTITTVWEQDGIRVEEKLYFAQNSETGRRDTTAIEYTIKNNNASNRNVGLRIMLDTMIGDNDGAPFFVLGIGQRTQEIEFSGNNVPESWIAYESPVFDASSLKSRGQLSGGSAIRPDRFVIAHWGSPLCGGVQGLFDTPWDYTPDSNFTLTCDSAVALYYNPLTLGPGQTKTYRTFYGLGKPSSTPTFGLLSLPFPHNANENGLNRIYSFFDHEYPIYTLEPATYSVTSTVVIYTGDRVTGTVRSCTGHISCYSGHAGHDFSIPNGITVSAAHNGYAIGTQISCANSSPINLVSVTQGRYQTTYLHLQDDSYWINLRDHPRNVRVGERIGTVGNSGSPNCSTNAHLHFGVYYDQNNDGAFANPDELVDPYGWRNQCSQAATDPWTITFRDRNNAQHTGATSGWLWEFTPPACANVSAGNGQVLATTDGIIINIPADAISSPATIAYNIAPEPDGGFALATNSLNAALVQTTIATGHTFQISAIYTDGVPVTTFITPVSITLTYTDSDLIYGDESTLGLYQWEETSANWILLTTTSDTISNQAVAVIDRPGIFSLRVQPINLTPSLLSMSPSVVNNSGELNIVVTGTNFLLMPTLNLEIGGLEVHFVSSSLLTATVPAQMAPGNYDLILRNPDGQRAILPNAFTILNRLYLPIVRFASPPTVPPPCVIYPSTDVPKSIPDNLIAGATSTLLIPAPGINIVDLSLRIDSVTHGYDSDLQFTLTSPDGTTSVLLVDRVGGSGDNFTNTRLNDVVTAIAIENGFAPFSGTFRPDRPLSTFHDKPSAGVWSLHIADRAPADVGTLNAWSLEVCSQRPSGSARRDE